MGRANEDARNVFSPFTIPNRIVSPLLTVDSFLRSTLLNHSIGIPKGKADMVRKLNYDDFSGATRPFRADAELEDLEVEGEIPPELNGTFYRVMQDPYYPRDYYQSGAKTIPFDGDGSISAFRVAGGRCAFKQRYVLTERYVAERRAGRAVFGILKTPFSHHPCVRAVQDNTANTNVVVHAGRLLALSEQGPPYELDPNTMTTLGNTPFPGQLPKGAPYTAHPHVDPKTGELVGYGYGWKGVESNDCTVWVLDKDGKKTFERALTMPGNGFVHDCAIAVTVNYVKFKIDPQAETDQLDDPEVLVDVPCEFPRTDERFLMRKSRYTFMDCFDPSAVTDPALLYRGLNCLARYDHQRKKLEVMSPGPGCLVQEPCFSARGPDAAEGDGFLITLVDNVPRERNEIVIQDTRDFQTVVARVILPFRLRSAVHGNWVDAERIPATGPFIAPLPDLYTHPAAA
ncbi:hypothetical protein SLS56_004384 [Neofusicoccum ribis]|uniref:Lignostilbene dioxygenase n=1 Tax=Neofusicoccum ribis TaxID=45134 RepID=A0ABR3SWK3_9PEZI